MRSSFPNLVDALEGDHLPNYHGSPLLGLRLLGYLFLLLDLALSLFLREFGRELVVLLLHLANLRLKLLYLVFVRQSAINQSIK